MKCFFNTLQFGGKGFNLDLLKKKHTFGNSQNSFYKLIWWIHNNWECWNQVGQQQTFNCYLHLSKKNVIQNFIYSFKKQDMQILYKCIIFYMYRDIEKVYKISSWQFCYGFNIRLYIYLSNGRIIQKWTWNIPNNYPLLEG